MEGRVRVGDAPALKAGQIVRAADAITVVSPRRFVSRGGEKLEHALEYFGFNVHGTCALDIGASTGGFTDCLLQRGAASVVALDVGYGQLDWRLRNDSRVEVRERTNIRELPADAYPEGFDLIVADASFISLRSVLSRARSLLRDGGRVIALVKPQFEAGRERLGRGGVVRDPQVHRAVLCEVREALVQLGLTMQALTASPLRGPAGNREFLALLGVGGNAIDEACIDAVVNGEIR